MDEDIHFITVQMYMHPVKIHEPKNGKGERKNWQAQNFSWIFYNSSFSKSFIEKINRTVNRKSVRTEKTLQYYHQLNLFNFNRVLHPTMGENTLPSRVHKIFIKIDHILSY